MSKDNNREVLKSLSFSIIDQDGETALNAILENLRIVGRTLPQPEIYERARMAAVEAVIKYADGKAEPWLRFIFCLSDLIYEADVTRRFSARERHAIRFIEAIISAVSSAGLREFGRRQSNNGS